MKGVYIFLADGFEDMEAIATRDVLIRGGVAVVTVSITEDYTVVSSHGVTVMADMSFPDFKDLPDDEPSREDVFIFPGGMPGTRRLADHKKLMRMMQDHYSAGGTLAAICAAPGLVLSQLYDVEGVRFTCFDGFQLKMMEQGAEYSPESVVVDGRIITGRGAGHAVNFGLNILEYLEGQEVASKVKAGLML